MKTKLSPKECAVCGMSDARALVVVALEGARGVTLCGTHALVHERTGGRASTIEELRAVARDRRERHRRAPELDELAASLSAAFSGDRRRKDRRAS